MKPTKKKVLLAVAAALVTLALGAGGWVWLTPRAGSRAIHESQEKLLRGTDHAALLAVCRGLIEEHTRSNPGRTVRLLGDDPKLPESIKALKPRRVTIDDDRVRIEMGGGFFHYGVEGFRQGAVEYPLPGSRPLIAGLRYYEPE